MIDAISSVPMGGSPDVGPTPDTHPTMWAMPGDLYYGDNLNVMRNKIHPESIDLIYLDPPFNSDRTYNLLYKGSQSQQRAFVDTWRWDEKAESAFLELTGHAPPTVRVPKELSAMMAALKVFLYADHKDMLAYLSMMAIRLVEMKRVLRSTGSVFLHCDPTASHYLKLIMDSIFGPENFRNEVIWRRTGNHKATKRMASVHDTILWFSKSKDAYFKPQTRPYMRKHVEDRYRSDEQGRLKFSSGGNVLTGPGISGGESGMTWRGFDPSAKDRHWAVPGFLTEQMPPDFQSLGVLAKLDALYAEGLIDIVPDNAWPTPVRYLRDGDGDFLSDIWACQPYTEGTVYGTDEKIDEDVSWFGPTDPSKTGYQTEKPLGLLNRIIKMGCPEGGLVLDPFCGCGTTVEAAETLGRKWIGIDIAIRAVDVMKERLVAKFQRQVWTEYGEPSDEEQAAALADRDPYDFQWWAVRMIGGQPPKGEKKKGGDGGIDGEMTLQERGSAPRHVVISVKGGNLTPDFVRALKTTVDQLKPTTGSF